ncbi:D-alanyl-D-alanine carboxypeptidase family protein [Hominiventricola aquisgranensis]|uniref:serine-type D-Ala-D-Ala carboxypeptidase n=1 Tax=Hominiventricola aquisgranensis TaxID=3133164 RepID=A0ABV1HY10_9FIRM
MKKRKKWKPYLVCVLTVLLMMEISIRVQAEGTPENLYARSAVLMDADTGRILFGKNDNEVMPMASTTKIMTLLVTLEHADLDEIVEVSARAASMPDVQLHIREGERYRLQDLCYSLMLESHNDSAVAIAEHVGGTVEGFAAMMNQKAKHLGCYHTYFISPNGLDAEDEHGKHSTTARDLARIMRCCIKNETFLSITREPSWTFTDMDGNRSFTVQNKNAFLQMMEGALTGKTGFTNEAGYCYVGALERGEKRLITVVLACGWPNHKTWKWMDTKALMNYGLEDYHKETVGSDRMALEPLSVMDGQKEKVEILTDAALEDFLLKEDDEFTMKVMVPDILKAPVQAGELVGSVVYYINGQIVDLFPVYTVSEVKKIDLEWRLRQVIDLWQMGNIL